MTASKLAPLLFWMMLALIFYTWAVSGRKKGCAPSTWPSSA